MLGGSIYSTNLYQILVHLFDRFVPDALATSPLLFLLYISRTQVQGDIFSISLALKSKVIISSPYLS